MRRPCRPPRWSFNGCSRGRFLRGPGRCAAWVGLTGAAVADDGVQAPRWVRPTWSPARATAWKPRRRRLGQRWRGRTSRRQVRRCPHQPRRSAARRFALRGSLPSSEHSSTPRRGPASPAARRVWPRPWRQQGRRPTSETSRMRWMAALLIAASGRSPPLCRCGSQRVWSRSRGGRSSNSIVGPGARVAGSTRPGARVTGIEAEH